MVGQNVPCTEKAIFKKSYCRPQGISMLRMYHGEEEFDLHRETALCGPALAEVCGCVYVPVCTCRVQNNILKMRGHDGQPIPKLV